jgi:hypothetical protein
MRSQSPHPPSYQAHTTGLGTASGWSQVVAVRPASVPAAATRPPAEPAHPGLQRCPDSPPVGRAYYHDHDAALEAHRPRQPRLRSCLRAYRHRARQAQHASPCDAPALHVESRSPGPSSSLSPVSTNLHRGVRPPVPGPGPVRAAPQPASNTVTSRSNEPRTGTRCAAAQPSCRSRLSSSLRRARAPSLSPLLAAFSSFAPTAPTSGKPNVAAVPLSW